MLAYECVCVCVYVYVCACMRVSLCVFEYVTKLTAGQTRKTKILPDHQTYEPWPSYDERLRTTNITSSRPVWLSKFGQLCCQSIFRVLASSKYFCWFSKIFERLQQVLHSSCDRSQCNKLIKIIIAPSRVVIALSLVVIALSCFIIALSRVLIALTKLVSEYL